MSLSLSLSRRVELIVGGLITTSLLACVGADGTTPQNTEVASPRWDVRGNYKLTHEDKLTITLNIGGVERRATASGDERIVDLGMHEGKPLTLDLDEYCGREEVVCPSEALWNTVAIDQREVDKAFDAHVINVIDLTDKNPAPGTRAEVIGGFVNHKERDQFLLGIHGESAQQGDCGALAISLANGRFQRAGERIEQVAYYQDAEGKTCEPAEGVEGCEEKMRDRLVIPPDGKVIGIADGKVGIGWLGACAFGPVVAGATLTIESSFTGVRTGDFDPPQFTPLEQPDVPDQNIFEEDDMGMMD